MERLVVAENNHLIKENSSLKKNFNTVTSRKPIPEFEDFIAALAISEIQRERISYLKKELEYVISKKNNLVEEESKNKSLKQLENQSNLEARFESARKKRAQLEMELESLEIKKIRDLNEIKLRSAKQNASLLSNL